MSLLLLLLCGEHFSLPSRPAVFVWAMRWFLSPLVCVLSSIFAKRTHVLMVQQLKPGEHTTSRVRVALGERSTCQNHINDLMRRALRHSDVPANKNRLGCLETTWNAQMVLRYSSLIDCSVPDTRCHSERFCSNILTCITSSLPGSAAEAAAIRKRSKYAAMKLTHICFCFGSRLKQ